MRRYYFDTESSAPDSVCDDHCGNIRGARTIAHKVANELNETVYINDFETNDIVDVVEPDSILDEVFEAVENSEPDTEIEPDKSEPDVKNLTSESDEINITVTLDKNQQKMLKLITLAVSIAPTATRHLVLDYSYLSCFLHFYVFSNYPPKILYSFDYCPTKENLYCTFDQAFMKLIDLKNDFDSENSVKRSDLP